MDIYLKRLNKGIDTGVFYMDGGVGFGRIVCTEVEE
jgi:hypothetical protein